MYYATQTGERPEASISTHLAQPRSSDSSDSPIDTIAAIFVTVVIIAAASTTNDEGCLGKFPRHFGREAVNWLKLTEEGHEMFVIQAHDGPQAGPVPSPWMDREHLVVLQLSLFVPSWCQNAMTHYDP